MSNLLSRQWKLYIVFLICAALSIYFYSRPANAFAFASPLIIQTMRAFLLLAGLFLLFEKLYPIQLPTKIFIGLILGGLAGILFQAEIVEIKPVGTAFLRLIQLIVVPLVLASLIVGTASLGDPKKLGRIGLKTLSYYLISTAFAITIGLIFANVFHPGNSVPPEIKTQLLQSYSGEAGSKIGNLQQGVTPIQTILNIIPTNPIASLSQGKMLQIIFFSIITGIALTLIPKEKADPVVRFFDGVTEAMIKIVLLVIKMAPYGVFALIAAAVGSFGISILFSLFEYTIVVIAGLLILSLLYPLAVKIFTGMSPVKFMRGIRPAQLIAFSTSSSGATLPVTMESCEENLGVSNNICSFVLPLGATVNMDGTALYQGVAAMFIAQVYGIPMDLSAQLTIILTATLASIGTAAVPGVGLFMLVIVLKQVGIPLEGIALILAVDRILDMFRTAINVTSDCTAAVIVASSEKEILNGVKEN